MKADGAEFPNSDDNRATSDMAWRSVSNLTAGLLLYGGIGWFLGRKFGHQDAFMAAGLILGIVLALYLTYARVSAMGRNTTTSDRRNDQI
jgi:F0F1-type ATP synthase assembly protein I